MSDTMSYEELARSVGPERAAAHRRKVAAMRAAGLHPDQVFGRGLTWHRGGDDDRPDRPWWDTAQIRTMPEDWFPPWLRDDADDE